MFTIVYLMMSLQLQVINLHINEQTTKIMQGKNLTTFKYVKKHRQIPIFDRLVKFVKL